MHNFDWIDVYNHTHASLELSAAVCMHPFASYYRSFDSIAESIV